jgi:O-antigen ligase
VGDVWLFHEAPAERYGRSLVPPGLNRKGWCCMTVHNTGSYAEMAPAPAATLESAPQREVDTSATWETILLVMLCFCAVAAYILHRYDLTWLGLGVFITPFVVACIMEPRVSLYAYGFLQAWDSAVAFGGDSADAPWITPAKLLSVIIIVTTIPRIWRSPGTFAATRSLMIWAVLFILAAFLSILWSAEVVASWRYTLQMIVQFVLIIIFMKIVGINRAALRRLFLWTVVGGATAGVYVALFGMEQQTFGRATLSDQANPVAVAMGLSVAFGCIPMVWAMIRRLWARVLLVAMGAPIFAAIIFGGTRAAVLSVLAGMAAAVVFRRKGSVLVRLMILVIGTALFYMAAVAVLYSGAVSDSAAGRLATTLMLPPPAGSQRGVHEVAIERGRSGVWLLNLQGYLNGDTGILGAGVGCSSFANLRTVGEFRDVHSNLLASLTEMGPLGLITFVGLTVAIFMTVYRLRNPKYHSAMLFLFLIFFLMGLVHTSYVSKLFWLPITFIACVAELDRREAMASLSGLPEAKKA